LSPTEVFHGIIVAQSCVAKQQDWKLLYVLYIAQHHSKQLHKKMRIKFLKSKTFGARIC